MLSLQKISKFGFGTGSSFKRIDNEREKKLIRVLRESVNYNINWFDTAESYFQGYSEELIGKAFEGREDIIIASKFSPENSSKQKLFNSLEKSLKRLRREFIDIYQIHWPPPYNDLEDICFALQKAIKQGKIRSVGVSNFLENDILLAKEILKDDLFSHQVELNPFNRSYETDFKLLHHKNNIRTLGYTPLKGLVNLKRNTEKYKLLFFLSCKYKKSINQIILNWLLSLGKNLSLIISTGNLDHLKQNVYLENFSLSKEDILKINNIFKSKIQFIEISKINLSLNTTYEIYQNINEALDNISGYSPSPKELSIEFMKNKKCKPIKLLKKNNNYYLTGGMIRFWAWVIAFNNSINIPSIVEEI